MAWNEPGDNSNKNDQDPWGGRRGGGRQGPPDLDEAFRKLQESLNRIFGGKKRGSSPLGNGAGGGFGLFGIGLAVLAVLWLYNAVYVVDEQEQAVILRLGKFHETVGPGLNFYFPPIDKKFQENVTRERAYSKQGQMLTEDENIVEVPLTVQYKISNLKDSLKSACSRLPKARCGMLPALPPWIRSSPKVASRWRQTCVIACSVSWITTRPGSLSPR